MSKFQQENSLQKREKESKRIRTKYPDRIPLICEKDCREKIVNDIDKKKYLVPTGDSKSIKKAPLSSLGESSFDTI